MPEILHQSCLFGSDGIGSINKNHLFKPGDEIFNNITNLLKFILLSYFLL